MEINNALSCSKFVYPVARRDETAVDDYHGQKVMFTFQLHKERQLHTLSMTTDTCRMAALEFRYGLEVQQTSVQKQTHLLCSFPFQFSLETINCLCHHRIIIQHIPLGHHSMREEILFNILVAPTFNQLRFQFILQPPA